VTLISVKIYNQRSQ